MEIGTVSPEVGAFDNGEVHNEECSEASILPWAAAPDGEILPLFVGVRRSM